MHVVAVVGYAGVVPLELAIPSEIFGRATLPDSDELAYEVRVCGTDRHIRTGPYDVVVPFDLSHAADADTVVVPGFTDLLQPPPPEMVRLVRAAAGRGARVASICSGAFVLAEAGLLDGRRATTHWQAAGELQRRHPRIEVDPNVLFVDQGQILTSAGVMAGFDLCLHMVRCDHGAAVAAAAARLAVMPLERAGGQAQFIVHEPPSSPSALAPLLAWLAENLERPLTLAEIARHGAMSTRSLNRKFMEQTGTTPLQWLLEARVRRAQELLETTSLSVEKVAAASGFQSAMTLRNRFRRSLGTTPTQYRQAFGGGPPRALDLASARGIGGG